MKQGLKANLLLVILVVGILLVMGYSAYRVTGGSDIGSRDTSIPVATGASGPVSGPVTFLELGSVGCIPCERMKPVMKGIEEKYGDRVKVEFHDVRVEHKVAQQYQIQLIPTQVFLDAGGREFFRHQGFLAQDDIEKMLASHGVQPTGGTP
jgi:thioredoxin 1